MVILAGLPFAGLSREFPRYRSYSTGLARWITAVRLQELLTGERPYDYSSSSPIDRTDPSGLAPCIYGKYCGPCSGPGDPIDELDKCCKIHDKCLATWKEWLNPDKYKQCQCDLCKCSAVANCHWGLKCNAARLLISGWACNSCINPCPIPGL